MTSFIWTNVVKQQSLKESSFVKSERAQIKSKTYEIKLGYLSSRLFSRSLTPQLLQSSGVIADNSRSSFFSPLKKSFKSFMSRLVFRCMFLFSRLSTYSSTEESWITKRFSLMPFAETGTFNINDGRNANKNYLQIHSSTTSLVCITVSNSPNPPRV